MSKLLFIVLDGIADRPISALDGKTPLEAAQTPHLDYFAKEGKMGYVYTVGKGIAPESDVAVCSLLGNHPDEHTGRGPIEAFGIDVKLEDKFLALRANFATVKNGLITDRRAGRIISKDEGKILEKEINKVQLSVPFRFYHTIAHRGVLIFWGDFSAKITNTDPAYEMHKTFGVAKQDYEKKIQISKPMEDTVEASASASVVNDFTNKVNSILENLELNEKRIENKLPPVNSILLRDAGTKLPNLLNINKETGRRWAGITGMPLEIGLSRLAGMEVLQFSYPPVEEQIPYLRKEITESLKKINSDFDAFYIHIKQTDIPGHDGDFQLKKQMIEIIDKEFFSKLMDQNYDICVTADHSTPCELKVHSDDPVPLLYYSPSKSGDSTKRFTESESKNGVLGMLHGWEIINLLRK